MGAINRAGGANNLGAWANSLPKGPWRFKRKRPWARKGRRLTRRLPLRPSKLFNPRRKGAQPRIGPISPEEVSGGCGGTEGQANLERGSRNPFPGRPIEPLPGLEGQGPLGLAQCAARAWGDLERPAKKSRFKRRATRATISAGGRGPSIAQEAVRMSGPGPTTLQARLGGPAFSPRPWFRFSADRSDYSARKPSKSRQRNKPTRPSVIDLCVETGARRRNPRRFRAPRPGVMAGFSTRAMAR